MSFTHRGGQIRRSTETEDKKLAITIFDKLKGELAEEKWFENLEGEKITFSEMMDKYMAEYSAINKAPRAIKKAGIERLRFHDLRHTFATRLVQNGVDLYRVQKLGRWKTTSMIMRYAHHYPESLRPRIETMDRTCPENITILSQSPKNKGSRPLLRLVTP